MQPCGCSSYSVEWKHKSSLPSVLLSFHVAKSPVTLLEWFPELLCVIIIFTPLESSSFLQIMELNNTVQLLAFAAVCSLICPWENEWW